MADLAREDADDNNYFYVCNIVIEATLKSFPKLSAKTLTSPKRSTGTGPAAITIVPEKSEPFFPPVGGCLEIEPEVGLTHRNIDSPSRSEPTLNSSNEVFNHDRELNVVAEPRRIVVSTSSWRASMQILGKEYEQVTIAQMDPKPSETPVWNVSKEFVNILSKLAYPELFKICSGITEGELKDLEVSRKQLLTRSYPGGAPRHESYSCLGVFREEDGQTFMRCVECRLWLKNQMCQNVKELPRKREANDRNHKRSSDSDCNVRQRPVTPPIMNQKELDAELKRRTALLREHVIRVKRSIEA